jgi:hypothetical protein
MSPRFALIPALLATALACTKPTEAAPPDTGLDPDECVPVTWYEDADGDGHGVVTSTLVDCSNAALSGYVMDVFDDCNDDNPQVHPGLSEVCDGIDQDCDAQVDEEATTSVPWHADLDGDGFGDAANIRDSCEQPAGYVEDATDCNDYDADVHPGASETCNGLDDDCDSTVDDRDELTYYPFYYDLDLDGFGDPDNSVMACEQPDGLLEDGTDCDDTNVDVFPGAEETCNTLDDDCDGTIDDPDVLPYTTYYTDDDGDGFGDPATAISTCDGLSGLVLDGTDCDDSAADVSPGSPEQCNGLDDNCNGVADDASIYNYWYPDGDGDGYGVYDPAPIYSCVDIAGSAPNDDDCDDLDPLVNPGEFEVCGDLFDSDCDGNDCAEWRDDFEDGLDPAWVNTSARPWLTTNLEKYAGAYSAVNGDIADSQRTEMTVTLTYSDPGTMEFWYKTSTEASYDYLKFYVDGALDRQWSGTVGWTLHTKAVTAGTHVFKWEYYKDGSVSSGSDSVWIDDVFADGGTLP